MKRPRPKDPTRGIRKPTAPPMKVHPDRKKQAEWEWCREEELPGPWEPSVMITSEEIARDEFGVDVDSLPLECDGCDGSGTVLVAATKPDQVAVGVMEDGTIMAGEQCQKCGGEGCVE